jgi:hypothetical protein
MRRAVAPSFATLSNNRWLLQQRRVCFDQRRQPLRAAVGLAAQPAQHNNNCTIQQKMNKQMNYNKKDCNRFVSVTRWVTNKCE